MAEGEASGDKPRVQTVARTVDILRLVARQPATGITAKRISDELSIPRQVVYHLVHTLVETDMLRKVGTAYVLGVGTVPLAEGFRRQISAPGVMAELAEQTARATGETAYVVGWIDGEAVIMATARGTAAVHAGEVALGTAGEAHARASGKMLLAMIPPHELDDYLLRHEMRRRTVNTITDPEAFKRHLAEIRMLGYAVERQEYAEGLCCACVPIGRMPSQLVLGLSAPAERFERNVATYLERLAGIAGR